MKKLNYSLMLMLPALIMLHLTSCVVSEKYRILEKSATRKIESGGSDLSVLVKPILAELQIESERVSATYYFKSDTLGVSKSQLGLNSSAKENAKNFALFAFMKDYNCDYVIDPIYSISRESETDSKFEMIKVSISGYPAKYKSFTQPDTLPRSLREVALMNPGRALVVSSNNNQKEAFKPFFGFGTGFNLGTSELSIGLPDFHVRFFAARAISLGYDFMNMRDYYSSSAKSKNHLFTGNLNLYSKKLNGIHFTGGIALGTFDGIADFDSFGLVFGLGGQAMITKNFALRGDLRSDGNFGGSFALGLSYYLR